jgi:hypothetical protein
LLRSIFILENFARFFINVYCGIKGHKQNGRMTRFLSAECQTKIAKVEITTNYVSRIRAMASETQDTSHPFVSKNYDKIVEKNNCK